MAYVNDFSDHVYDPTVMTKILGWLERHKGQAPRGTRGFNITRGITARKFVEVRVDVSEHIEDYRRKFFEWLKGAKDFNRDWLDTTFYSFKMEGKWTQPT